MTVRIVKGRGPVAVAVGLVASAVLAGCGPSSDPVVLRDGEVVTMASSRGPSGMEAQIVGTVVLGGSGCMSLDPGTGDESMPVMWPRGTRLDGSAVVLPSGARVAVGDQISGGGGETTVGTYPDVPPECRDARGDVAVVDEVD